MKALLDTCILSELQKKIVYPAVPAMIKDIGIANTFISALALGELIHGMERLKDGQKKRMLSSWLIILERDYESRILSADLEIARIWGKLTANLQSKGRALPIVDGLMAATALYHGLSVMTRNVSDFEPTGVMLINPWD